MGTCLLKEGLCVCFPGYAGTACEACASGYTLYAGTCQPVAATSVSPLEDEAPAAADVSRFAWAGRAWWVYVMSGAGGVLALVCALALLRAVRRRARRGPRVSAAPLRVRSRKVGPFAHAAEPDRAPEALPSLTVARRTRSVHDAARFGSSVSGRDASSGDEAEAQHPRAAVAPAVPPAAPIAEEYKFSGILGNP